MSNPPVSDERLRELIHVATFSAFKASAMHELELALRELLARREADAWRPIESAPKDGAEFQAWLCDRYTPSGWWEPRCRFNENGAFEVWQRTDYDQDDFDVVRSDPTHWRPLPAAPGAAT